jgi:RNA polymerase sigma-70 factor (ECF subfamily)
MDQYPGIVLSLFALAMAVPLLYGSWGLGVAGVKGLVLVARRSWQARHPLEAVALAPMPPRCDLSLDMRRLAHTTRDLVASLEHASQRSAGWRDDAPRHWLTRWATLGRDQDFRPTIGVTGEVWDWLRSAEALADSDDSHADVVGRAAAAVRDALLRNGPLGPRLAEMLAYLVRADGELRATSASPYRGTRAVPSKRALGLGGDNDEERRLEYDEALRKHEGAITRVARRYTRDAASTEDLSQEIKLSVWEALDRFRGDASLKTYVLRIAHYRGVSFFRRQHRTVPVGDEQARGPEPDELIDDARKRVAVAEAIEALPHGQRDAITLLLEGLSYREIGQRLGITDKATSVRITRARQALRRQLAGV